MEDIVQRAIKLMESHKKDPKQMPWKSDQPFQQPCYLYRDNRWMPFRNQSHSGSDASSTLKGLSVWSWNIDLILPLADQRMKAAIIHLRSLIELDQTAGKDMAHVIFLAECLETDLGIIAADPWVQSHFILADVDTEFWASGLYGTTTLIDRRLGIKDCFRVHYSKTRMERDALFVDIIVDGPPQKIVRLCNTHLESLALEPPYRLPQMETCSKYMHALELHGAILAGDLNAIQPFDRTLHAANQLKDAYLELGGSEDDAESGHTWGQQAATAQRKKFGTSRMDKVFFCGAVQLKSFARFGAEVELEDASERQSIVDLGFDKAWITDHLGVHASFEWTSDSRI